MNRELLLNGFGEWVPYYRQHPDSVAAFKNYANLARQPGLGMWEDPERVGKKIPKVEPGSGGNEVQVVFPININTAGESELQALTGIGPALSSGIIEYRYENGAFTDVEELNGVSGTGPVTMEGIRPYVTVD